MVYHGSNVEVANPRILQSGFYKDFGWDIQKALKTLAFKGSEIL